MSADATDAVRISQLPLCQRIAVLMIVATYVRVRFFSQAGTFHKGSPLSRKMARTGNQEQKSKITHRTFDTR